MKFGELATTARDAMTAKRVFAEPVERDGVTVIGVASVGGGAGGGSGQADDGQQGEGGGFGIRARPVGAYVVKDGKVAWMPAVDVNQLLMIIAAVLGIFMITRSRVVRARLKAGTASPSA